MLFARVVLQSAAFFVGLALLLFLPAGTLHYWQAWAFLIDLLIVSTTITVWLAFTDPKLLERRLALGERCS